MAAASGLKQAIQPIGDLDGTGSKVTVFSIQSCPHCRKVKGLFDSKGWGYQEVSLSSYPEKKADMLQLTDRLTVPQIFFANTHMGGAADIDELHMTGKLNDAYKKLVLDFDGKIDDRLLKPQYAPKQETITPAREDEKFRIAEDEYTYTELVDIFLKELDIKDRSHHLRSYKKCFTGKDLVTFLMTRFNLKTREEALQVGQQLFLSRVFSHVCKDHPLKDEALFYRLEAHEEPHVLNKLKLWNEQARSPVIIVREAKSLLSQLQSAHLDSEGLLDYKKLVADPKWRDFQLRTTELQKADFTSLSENEKLACGINTYNMMVTHAFAQVGIPQSSFARLSFFDAPAYDIGGQKITLSELENGVIRGNKRAPSHLARHFKANDPRLAWSLKEVDCRIHFALNCGAKSCPPVKNYTPDAVSEELRIAALAFCEQSENVTVDVNARTVFLSKIFQWYSADFGKNNKEVLTKVETWLRGDAKKNLQQLLLLDSSAVKVRYFTYDWGTNAKNAKNYEG